MINWKKGIELLNEKALKSLEYFRTSDTGTLYNDYTGSQQQQQTHSK